LRRSIATIPAAHNPTMATAITPRWVVTLIAF